MGTAVADRNRVLSGPEKALLFLLSLPEDAAAPIIAELGDAELGRLRQVASGLRAVPPDAIEGVFAEFLEMTNASIAVPHGGIPYLRRLTAGALGEGRAREVFDDPETPISRLEQAPPDTLAALVESEPPQLVAALLARLAPAAAAAVLAALPDTRQADVVARVGRLTDLPADFVDDVATALAAQLPPPQTAGGRPLDGVTQAAQILNAAGKSRSTAVLADLEVGDPDLAGRVRLAMFRFEDLRRLDARAMRTLVRAVPTERLTVALKGVAPEVQAAVFAGLSSRAAELIRDDLEVLGSLRRAEVEAARQEVVQTALRLEADGVLDLGRGEE